MMHERFFSCKRTDAYSGMQILFQQYCKRFASDLSFAVIIYVITVIMPKLKRRKNVWEIFIVYFQFLNEAVFAKKKLRYVENT